MELHRERAYIRHQYLSPRWKDRVRSLSFQSDFEKAESIFQRLCPGEEFLSKPVPQTLDKQAENDGASQQAYQKLMMNRMSGLDIDDDLYSDDD